MSTDTNTHALSRGSDVPQWVMALLALTLAAAALVSGASHRAHAVERGRAVAIDLPGLHALVEARLPRYAGPGVAARERRAVERVMARTPYVVYGGRGKLQVALTFDDGPGPYTWQVVRVLRRMHVPATFFQVGQMVAAFPHAARLVERSFPVGDHTLSHPMMSRLPVGAQRWEVRAQAWRLRAVDGIRAPVLFRPPYASFDRRTFQVLHGERMLMVLWDVDSADWTRPGPRAIARNVVSAVRPGSIVLMHDAGGNRAQTVAALPLIVRRLRARGFRFVTVPRMMLTAPSRAHQKLPPGAGA